MTRKLLHLFAAVLLLSLVVTATAYGTEASVFLECIEETAKGTSFSAALEYRGATFSGAVIEVTYDPEVLEFRSCSGGEGYSLEAGLAKIQLDGGDGREYLSCKIRFHGAAAGESFITVTASDMVNTDGQKLVAETRSVKVKVLSEEEMLQRAEELEAETQDSADKTEQEDVSADHSADGGLLGLLYQVKEGFSDGTYLNAVADGYQNFMAGLSTMEFLVLSLCISIILLLLVLLAARRKRGK